MPGSIGKCTPSFAASGVVQEPAASRKASPVKSPREVSAAVTRPLVDRYGRHISYLRVSVTDRCDFRCVYCMSENMSFLPKADLLTLEELDRLCSAFVARGVRKRPYPSSTAA